MINLIQLEAVKDRIFEIIGARIELRRSGANWTGLCPFHDDRNPSFSVSERKRRWACFVCNLSGDTIDFIQRFHGTDFKGALAILGITDDNQNPENSERVMHALAEIKKDEGALLWNLDEREEHLQFLSRHITWLINAVPPLERESRWYSWEHWLDQEFEEIETERERTHEIARRHRKEVFQWTKQAR